MFVCCCKISMGRLECSVMALMNSRSRTPSGEDTSLIWDLSCAAQVEAGCSRKWQILGQLLPILLSSPHQGNKALMTSLTPDDGKESGDSCVSCRPEATAWSLLQLPGGDRTRPPSWPHKTACCDSAEKHCPKDLHELNWVILRWHTPSFLLELKHPAVRLCFSVLITSKSLWWTALLHLYTGPQVSFPLGQALTLSRFVRPLLCAVHDNCNIEH